nr:HepT-like ribonuclease domain-containing protein [Skermanella sp. TT6]
MSPSDRLALGHIRDACALIMSFAGSVGSHEFREDRRSISAIAYQLIIIGEATKRLSRAFRDRHGAINWRSIAGTRDVLVHDFRNLDVIVLWRTAPWHVPILALAVSGILDPLRARDRRSWERELPASGAATTCVLA